MRIGLDVSGNVHVYVHVGAQDEVLRLLQQLNVKVDAMSQEVDQLQEAVSRTAGVIDSAVVLIRGIREQIEDAGTDRAKLREITQSLSAKEGELAAAVAEPGTEPGTGEGGGGESPAPGTEPEPVTTERNADVNRDTGLRR